MKKFLICFVLLFNLVLPSYSADFTGRWAEKISERVVMDIFSKQNDNEYKIFITWREDKLAQKDIYRFDATDIGNGVLKYKNGVHIYRYFDSKNKFKDETDYTDGEGTIKIKGNEIIWQDDKAKNEDTVFIRANKSLIKDSIVKNKLFSIMLPQELKGTYDTKIDKNTITLYHKASKKAGFGGFGFGIRAYKTPADHAMLPGGEKIGELKDKKNNLYDIVLKYPTDVQYDYTKSEKPESYVALYDTGRVVKIKGLNGSTYYKNQGAKGEGMYKDILNKHIKAINEKWDSTKLEKEEMSYMYNVITQSGENALDKIGYTYYDTNGDGIEELLIGEITSDTNKGIIYDIYTMTDRKPAHVISGGTRDRYFVCNDSFICNDYSAGAEERGWLVYILVENSTELFPQVGFKYDAYTNKKNPWFLSYDFFKDEWQNVDEAAFKDRKAVFDRYKRFDFIPLNAVK